MSLNRLFISCVSKRKDRNLNNEKNCWVSINKSGGYRYMEVGFIDIGQVADKELKFAVISASYQGKWIFVKHKQRDTWEIAGGHRERDEDITDTAKRELFEETGARNFIIKPICDYSVIRGDKASYGRLFYAEIIEFGDLPDMEIGTVQLFDKMPVNLTYPEIQPFLHERSILFINQRN